jgi:response regulator NasT
MRVMLVDDDPDRRATIESTLRAIGSEIVCLATSESNLAAAAERGRPDIILIDVESPSRDTLESLGQVSRDCPRPIVLFTDQGDTGMIRRALKAGVTSYVLAGMNPAQLRAVLDVAIIGFEEYQKLKADLQQAKDELAKQGDVEMAKSLVMQRRNVDAAEALGMIRNLAKKNGISLGDAARMLITASSFL